MSLQTIGFKVLKRERNPRPGRNPKIEPLSRLYHSQEAAAEFARLAMKQFPDHDVYVEGVQKQEGGRSR